MTVLNLKPVGNPIVDMALGRQHVNHFMEASGHHADLPTVFMQRVDKLQCTLGEMQLVMHRVEHGDRQALQQGHSCAQRIAELQFAAHGACGHSGNLLTAASHHAQLVDNLFVNERGVHIHNQQAGLAQRRHRNRRISRAPNFALGGLVNKMHIFLRHASDSGKTLEQCPL